jgi:cytidine deaminase
MFDPGARLEELVTRAREVAQHAYAPASGFHVGAALLDDQGRVQVGCNVENASYGLTVCAERNAVFRAVADGARAILAIAVHTPIDPPGSPCGACRQVLAEFAAPEVPVLLVGADPAADVEWTTVGELLPRPFRFERRLDEDGDTTTA